MIATLCPWRVPCRIYIYARTIQRSTPGPHNRHHNMLGLWKLRHSPTEDNQPLACNELGVSAQRGHPT